jgi:mRNA-degrading endonuclease YafQ of YafQ-DinJ toxin-antitoxin module
VEVSFSSSFKRSFKKRLKGNADLSARFWQKLEQFTIEPFEPSLKTHKLSGKLKELWHNGIKLPSKLRDWYLKPLLNLPILETARSSHLK